MIAFSPEFRLCAQCCRWAFARDNERAVHEMCGAVDWDRFTRVVRYHRVQGLVWNCLSVTGAEVSDEAALALSSDARAIAAENLQMAAEAGQIRAEFEQAGVALLFVKGLAVGALAYPKPLLKMGWDIDLLIDPGQLSQAIGLLQERGYRQIIPQPAADIHSWHRRRKESVWRRNGDLHVELHTRLADNSHLIPNIDVHSPRCEVEVADGIGLLTLARDELFAYLCVHGASSNWFRLKWITDVAALLHKVPDIDRLYQRSQALGAHRAARQALLLADRLFATLDGVALKEELLKDRASGWLADAAIAELAGRAEPREPTSTPLGTWRIHLTQLLLKRGPRYKLNELHRQIDNAIM